MDLPPAEALPARGACAACRGVHSHRAVVLPTPPTPPTPPGAAGGEATGSPAVPVRPGDTDLSGRHRRSRTGHHSTDHHPGCGAGTRHRGGRAARGRARRAARLAHRPRCGRRAAGAGQLRPGARGPPVVSESDVAAAARADAPGRRRWGPAGWRGSAAGNSPCSPGGGSRRWTPTSPATCRSWSWRRWCPSPCSAPSCRPTGCPRSSSSSRCPLIPVFMALIGIATRQRMHRQWRALSTLSAHILDIVAGLPTLRLFGRARAQADVLRRTGDEYRRAHDEPAAAGVPVRVRARAAVHAVGGADRGLDRAAAAARHLRPGDRPARAHPRAGGLPSGPRRGGPVPRLDGGRDGCPARLRAYSRRPFRHPRATCRCRTCTPRKSAWTRSP